MLSAVNLAHYLIKKLTQNMKSGRRVTLEPFFLFAFLLFLFFLSLLVFESTVS